MPKSDYQFRKGKNNSNNRTIQADRDTAIIESIGHYPVLTLTLLHLRLPHIHLRKLEQRTARLAQKRMINRYELLDGRLIYTTLSVPKTAHPQFEHRLMSSTWWLTWDLATESTDIQTLSRTFEHDLRVSDFPGSIPDNVCVYRSAMTEALVIECDTGSEALTGQLSRKTYLFHKLLTHFQQRREIREWLGGVPFRILTITRGERRVEHLRKLLYDWHDDTGTPVFGSDAFLITDESQYSPQRPASLLGKIWTTAQSDNLVSLLDSPRTQERRDE